MRLYWFLALLAGTPFAAAAPPGAAVTSLAQSAADATPPAGQSGTASFHRADQPPNKPRPAQESIPPPPQVGLTLDQAVDIALRNSPTLREAQARVIQARGRAIQAGLYPNPRLDSGNPQQLGGTQGLYNLGITQDWVRGGKLRLSRSAAEQAVRQSELGLVRARFDLLTAVRTQFYVVLAVERRLTLLKQLLKIAQEAERASGELLRAGHGTEIDLLLLRVERQRAQAAIQSTEAEANGARRQLAAILGAPGLPISNVAGDLNLAVSDLYDLAFRRDLLARNAQIGLARAEIVRTRLLLERARVEPIPNITWVAGYQYTVSPTHNQALLAANFNIPIWDRNQGNILAAQGHLREAVAGLSAIEFELVRQLSAALSRFQAAVAQVRNFEQQILPTAERNLKLVVGGYEEGELDFFRYLESQRLYFQVQLDYIAAQQERWAAAAAIAGLLQLEQFP
jgi:cobalt-zinc-cadmium efflux system outer membrane protein